MRNIVALTVLLAGGFAMPAHAQNGYSGNECPPNTRANGALCQISVPGSIRNPGSCPAEYVSTADGAYCILAPRKEWVRAKPACPSNYKASPGGEFCVGQ